MTLILTGLATVKHVNLRKEGPQENQVLACDLKIQTTQSAEVLAYFHSTLRNLLFTADGNPQIPNLKPIALEGSIRNLEAVLDIKFVLLACEASKFTFQPINGERVIMNLSLTYCPQAHEVSRTAELINRDIQILIKSQPSLLESACTREEFLEKFRPPAPTAPLIVNVDLDKACTVCGKGGATDSGICLKCVANSNRNKKLKSTKNARL